MRLRKPTVFSHLKDALDMPIKRVPFGRLIIMYAPEDSEVDNGMRADEVLKCFQEEGYTKYLKLPLEELVLFDEQKKTRKLARFAFYTGLIGSFVALIAISAIGYITQEYPHWALLAPPLIIPGFIMWKQVGLFNAENARGIAQILGNVLPWNRGGNQGGNYNQYDNGYEDDYDDRPRRRRNRRDEEDDEMDTSTQDVEERPAKTQDEETTSTPSNGNPYADGR